MAKPIPVFAFVFAAYAAVTAGASLTQQPTIRSKPPRRSPLAVDKMLETWRVLQRRSVNVSAQISSSNGRDESSIWLRDVVERNGTLSGLRAGSYEGLADRISFDANDVLSWRMGYDEREDFSHAPHRCGHDERSSSPTEFA